MLLICSEDVFFHWLFNGSLKNKIEQATTTIHTFDQICGRELVILPYDSLEQQDMFRIQLKGRRRKMDESLTDFMENIQRLFMLANTGQCKICLH